MSATTAPPRPAPPGSSHSPGSPRSPYEEDAAVGVHAISLEPDPSLRAGDPVDPLAARLLPEQTCRHFRMIGVAAERGTLTVAMAAPADALARQVAAALSKAPLDVVTAPPDQIERAIERAFAGLAAPAAAAARAPAPGRLGGLLVGRGLIEAADLADALDTQARSGGRLGEILIAEAGLEEAALGEALADQLRVPLVDLDGLEPSAEALELLPEALQRRGRCLPLEIDADTLYVAVADPLDDVTYAAIRELTDLRIRVHIALPSQLERMLRKLHRDEHLRSARAELLARDPGESANRVFSGGQRLALTLVAAAVAAGFALAPATAAIVLCAVAAAASVPPALWWLLTAVRGRGDGEAGDAGPARIDERLLPRYTVVVPVFDADASVPGLVESLTALDYPAAKLEALLVVRPGDRTAIETIRSCEPPPWIRVLPFADSRPGRVAAGCNYALQQASGRFVAVYGPDDRPAPDQLKRALLAFEQGGGEVACVQSRLRCEEGGTRAALEQAVLFDLLLPGASRSRAALPLGPSGHHLDRDVVRSAGGWDPFNSAPEIELGIRLRKHGRETALIDSPTTTACETEPGERRRRRARLCRGAMQTYLVETRSPRALAAQLGLGPTASLQLMFGALAGALLMPLLAAAVALWAAAAADLVEVEVPDAVLWLGAAQLVAVPLCFAALQGIAARPAGTGRFAAIVLAPARWLAISASAWRGLWQLLRRPFHP